MTPKILVVGDVMLDRYWYGVSDRLSQEAPVPVVKDVRVEERLGGAGNVALNLAQLGCDVRLACVVGDDKDGRNISWMLERAGIEDLSIPDLAAQTTVKLRIIVGQQQLLRVDTERRTIPAEVSDTDIQWADIVALSDYSKGALDLVHDIIRMCREAGKETIVDPKRSDWSAYRGCACIKPNIRELQGATNRDCWSSAMVVTSGERGMLLYDNHQRHYAIASEARSVYDVTGAGDTVLAVLAWQRALGKGWLEAAQMANRAAGIVVGKCGTTAIRINELQ